MKRCPYCNELNGDTRMTCYKCGKTLLFLESWQTSKIQSWGGNDNSRPQWHDIILRTRNSQGELRLKEHSLSVKMAGKITEIPLEKIVSITISKEPSSKFFPGLIEIKTASSPDLFVKLTSFLSIGNGNIIAFPHSIDYKHEARQLQRYIAGYKAKPDPAIQVSAQTAIPSSNPVSSADEIRKYKELLDVGAITQDEYDEKKRQLLGL